MRSKNTLQALIPGRVVLVKNKRQRQLGVIVRRIVGTARSLQSVPDTRGSFVALLLSGPTGKVRSSYPVAQPATLSLTLPPGTGPGAPAFHGEAGGGAFTLCELVVSDIASLCKLKVKLDLPPSAETVPHEIVTFVVNQLLRIREAYAVATTHLHGMLPVEEGGVQAGSHKPSLPEINPVTDLRITDLEFTDKWRRLERVRSQMSKSKCHQCPRREEQFATVDGLYRLQQRVAQIKYAVSDENLQLMPEFTKRVDVLRTLHFLDDDGNVVLKGRVACEINTCEALIVTELLFENILSPLEPDECAALLSSLIFQEKDACEPLLTDVLERSKNQLIDLTCSLAAVQRECGLDIVPNEYVKLLNFGLMEVVYEWAKGVPFADICQLTNVFEGSIVRTITRLNELLREVRNAARVIGDPAMYQKMEEAQRLIKRDIVFAASLYVA